MAVSRLRLSPHAYFACTPSPALTRAERLAGSWERMNAHQAEVRQIAETVPDEESKKLLPADLNTSRQKAGASYLYNALICPQL